MYKQLTREQRYAIYLGKQEGKSQTAIAQQIGVNKSTVSRELKRNRGVRGHYNYERAMENTKIRRERSPGNRSIKPSVMKQALTLLTTEDWSPRQISGHLKKSGVQISHESIYAMIRSDESGELRGHCRHKMKYRRHVKAPRKTRVRIIPGRTSIHERPAEADGSRFGDWEMDLIVGKGQKSAILTMCERASNFLLMTRVPSKRPADVADAATALLLPYRKNVKTITTDNGTEFIGHQSITAAIGAKVYFADSYCSWQKGCIENTNKLIRQYLPKGSDFNEFTDDFIRAVQYKLNRRPREKLNFDTPKDWFFNLLL